MQSIHFALLSLKLRFMELKDEERGATGVEYGLLVALIAAVIIVTVAALGLNINDAFCEITSQFGDNAGDCGA